MFVRIEVLNKYGSGERIETITFRAVKAFLYKGYISFIDNDGKQRRFKLDDITLEIRNEIRMSVWGYTFDELRAMHLGDWE